MDLKDKVKEWIADNVIGIHQLDKVDSNEIARYMSDNDLIGSEEYDAVVMIANQECNENNYEYFVSSDVNKLRKEIKKLKANQSSLETTIVNLDGEIIFLKRHKENLEKDLAQAQEHIINATAFTKEHKKELYARIEALEKEVEKFNENLGFNADD